MQILVLSGMYFLMLWSICHQPDTFIQVGSGHTVYYKYQFLGHFAAHIANIPKWHKYHYLF